MNSTPSAAPPASRLLAENTAVRHLALVLLFGALTALSAQIRWHLPGSEVPITAQVFVVLLSGALLGARLGAASQLSYIAFGVLGAPVFAGGLGPAALLGPTGGYLWGFVIAAAAVGAAVQRGGSHGLAIGMLLGLAAIYLCGATWLAVWSHMARELPWPAAIARAIGTGVVPFLLPDAVKALLAAAVARRALR